MLLILFIFSQFNTVQTFGNFQNKFSQIFEFFRHLKPSAFVNNLLTNQNVTNLSDFYETEEQKNWFLNHLAKREELAKAIKKIYIIISLKKVFKFFLLMVLMFFLPVLNSNEPVYNENLTDDYSYDLTNFISKFSMCR